MQPQRSGGIGPEGFTALSRDRRAVAASASPTRRDRPRLPGPIHGAGRGRAASSAPTDEAGAHVEIAKLEQQIQQLEIRGRSQPRATWTRAGPGASSAGPPSSTDGSKANRILRPNPSFSPAPVPNRCSMQPMKAPSGMQTELPTGCVLTPAESRRSVFLRLDPRLLAAQKNSRKSGKPSGRLLPSDRNWTVSGAHFGRRLPLSRFRPSKRRRIWLDRRGEAVEQLRTSAALRLQVNQSEDQIRFGERPGNGASCPRYQLRRYPSRLLEIGRRILQRETDARTQRRDLEREQKRLGRHRTKAERQRSDLADKARADWDRRWTTATTGLPVPTDAKPDSVQEVVRLLDTVAADSEQINELVHRIQAMERDDHDFSAAVAGNSGAIWRRLVKCGRVDHCQETL